ncbi:MAG: DUF6356 family protein [Acidimicrobiales bacterium]|nr:hypothetical protein [Actinomycetes bacterium]MDP6912043.1 DUF6356 family protein [Acidimicrobiales bacterium]HJM73901.1 DUF6356 family protein [Acidimicrobiales bacterium]HJP23985.1 DUF6356 family protein [Acidimicrobiales bacterium]
MVTHYDANSHNVNPRHPSTLFTAHPASVGETWSQHARFAFSAAGRLVVAAMAAAVHALFPFLFQTTASRTIDVLHSRIHGPRGNESVVTTTTELLAE